MGIIFLSITSHFSLFCLSGRLFFNVPYFHGALSSGNYFLGCPIFLVPRLIFLVSYFPGALFSKVPYILGCLIFWCPVFPPPLLVLSKLLFWKLENRWRTDRPTDRQNLRIKSPHRRIKIANLKQDNWNIRKTELNIG